MRIFKGPLLTKNFYKPLLFSMLLLGFAVPAALAQSANHKPNLNPAEFTEKGINIGWMAAKPNG